LAELAAEALCRSDDLRALEALQPVLRGDLDPVLRARVAHALRLSHGAVAGGGPAEALAAVARALDAAPDNPGYRARRDALRAITQGGGP
ncbi:hypothetical protein HOI71_05955, partial [Candidatus Poribacteria bacterium]|nr:hypothetical protein [Candidatus Poribacteria bacterium]